MPIKENKVSLEQVQQNSPSEIQHHTENYTAGTQLIMQQSGTVRIEPAASAITLLFGYDTLKVGDELPIVNMSATYSADVIASSGFTWDGTNDRATFGTGGDALLVRAVSSDRFLIIVNVGSVVLS